jgi:hypothetical protein
MSAYFYIVTEGVHDVAFIGKLLSVVHGANRISKLEDLDDSLRGWVEAAFKWPRFTGKHHDIERLAVPAPVFYSLPAGELVALRNAQGITEISKTLTVDLEAFTRIASGPESIGVVLDSDDEPAQQRFDKLTKILEKVKLTVPTALGEVNTGKPRVGVFTLPEPGSAGTLEDILLTLSDGAYPDLAATARAYADQWRKKADSEPTVSDWREIRKPSGAKKAAMGAMTAVLKPGKSMQVSLEDGRWVCNETKAAQCLQPCIRFLDSLLKSVEPTAQITS